MANPSLSQRRATAFHEAGHAVVAVWENVRFRYVTIVPGDGAAGHLRHLRTPWQRAGSVGRGSAERQARICLAGPIAQRRFSPRSVRRYHAHGDYEMATDLALRLGSSKEEADAWVRLWEIQVRGHLDRRWPAVESLAAALVERGTVSGEEARRLTLAATAQNVCGQVREGGRLPGQGPRRAADLP